MTCRFSSATYLLCLSPLLAPCSRPIPTHRLLKLCCTLDLPLLTTIAPCIIMSFAVIFISTSFSFS
ncbi:hypothetical protein OE88DRAFT_1695400 [Heliocybe sulcata]|uniref:Uncharacterized protein n=1 Tax=Heliocybe sulcata TaxID=5364 RepID=A0A5C3NAZ7_9AGAM|nr:hypothetical protein OE88DRAFT_1695400 [Heliocybe sulcata]